MQTETRKLAIFITLNGYHLHMIDQQTYVGPRKDCDLCQKKPPKGNA